MSEPVETRLAVEGLAVGYEQADGSVTKVVDGVSFALRGGRVLGLAGESGCGKSTAALAAIGYRGPGARVLSGRSMLGETNLLDLPSSGLRGLWGSRIAYVAQDAAGSLNPAHRIGAQVAEALQLHTDLSKQERTDRVLSILDAVGIKNPKAAVRRYPHEFSGGQQQRISLAAAMISEPDVLILDEPTTGLDVTTQEQISALIADLVARTGTAGLQISHDLVLLASICQEMVIMYGGEVVESGAATDVYRDPRHPYSAALIKAVPTVEDPTRVTGIPGLPPSQVIEGACAFADRCEHAIPRCREIHPSLAPPSSDTRRQVRCIRADDLGSLVESSTPIAGTSPSPEGQLDAPLLVVSGLECSYGEGGSAPAVRGVDLEIKPGETLAVVGESGSGKSTLLRAVAGLHPPDSGSIAFDGVDLAPRAVSRPRQLRQDIQLVFQDPHASLNPRQSIGLILDRPLRLFHPEMNGRDRRARIYALLDDVRLDGSVVDRLPSELSGGQKQRVAMARAFAADPRLLLCDEVVSALDVSVQASLLELLEDLIQSSSVAVLFVTHDLAIVRQIADRVCVMQSGRFCESGPTERIFAHAEHPYTQKLLASVPSATATA